MQISALFILVRESPKSLDLDLQVAALKGKLKLEL